MLKGPRQEIPFEHLLELIDRANPKDVALIATSGSTTYGVLKQKYLAAGRQIAEQSPKRVAISMERDGPLIFSFLGCLHQGISYLYIDPDLPIERKRELIREADIDLFVASRDPGTLPVPIHILQSINVETSVSTPTTIRTIGEAAILVYTSGTTGTGKCIRLHHRGLINNCLWRHNVIGITPRDTILHNINFSFDPSLWQLYGALAAGATVVLGSERIFHDLRFQLSLIQKYSITITDFVPSILRLILEEDAAVLKQLRAIFIGGEILSPDLVKRLIASTSCRIFNQYGPAEATIDATSYEVLSSLNKLPDEIPIGTPISNVMIQIVDENLNELPQGEVGEICVGGIGVSLGYTRLQDRNKFIGNFYQTGDLGVINRSGEILFRGRMDEQVKISGQRVELSEIERAAEKVTTSPVCVKLVGEHQLGLFTTDSDFRALREALLKTLPSYMVPSRYFSLKSMPISSNGKISRRDIYVENALEWRPLSEELVTQSYSEIESFVLTRFKKALGECVIPWNVDFFVLGGTSLEAIRIISQLKKKFGIEADFKSLMNNFTIQSISEFLQSSDRLATKPFQLKKTYPLSPLQVVPGLLPESQVVNLVEFPAGSDIRGALQKLIAHHPLLCGGIVSCQNVLDFNSQPIIEASILSDSESELIRAFPLGKRCFQAVLDGNRVLFSFKRMVYDARSMEVFEQELSRALHGETLQGSPDGFYRHLEKFGDAQAQPQNISQRIYHHHHFEFSRDFAFMSLFKGIGKIYRPRRIAAPVLNRHTEIEENSLGRFVQLRSLEPSNDDITIRQTFFGSSETDSDAFSAEFFLNVIQSSEGPGRDGFTYSRLVRDHLFNEPFPNLVIAVERKNLISVHGYLEKSVDFSKLERYLKNEKY